MLNHMLCGRQQRELFYRVDQALAVGQPKLGRALGLSYQTCTYPQGSSQTAICSDVYQLAS